MEEYVPKLWKGSNVTQIDKKGSRTVAVNYKNVFLASLVCRSFEGQIRDKLSEFLENYGLIATEKHGFVKRKECVTNLLQTLDLITKSLPEGFSCRLIQ